MASIFLPIKPVYADRLLSGEKRFEYRKSIPSKDISAVVIYASSPKKMIVGIGIVDHILCGSVSDIWQKTRHASGINKDAYLHYFEGKRTAYAIQFSEIRRLTTMVPPETLSETFRIPQSFTYIDDDNLKSLTDLEYETVKH
ncbi:hypothetical protein [Pseudodesulfovibrio karagichevae]|uniref:ASCH domain-containing protein n=1 Tax=Pseudodesulfovibrio karagichevae TaxID=3239305 RepID=A0ABV4K4Z9_9BACT